MDIPISLGEILSTLLFCLIYDLDLEHTIFSSMNYHMPFERCKESSTGAFLLCYKVLSIIKFFSSLCSLFFSFPRIFSLVLSCLRFQQKYKIS